MHVTLHPTSDNYPPNMPILLHFSKKTWIFSLENWLADSGGWGQ